MSRAVAVGVPAEDYRAEIEVGPSTGLVLAEEAALKTLVSGMTVPGRGGEQSVPVWFRWPESETTITYPHITIDLLGPPVPDYERWTSVYDLGQAPVEFVDDVTGARRIGMYSPSMSPDSMPTEEPLTSLLDPTRADGLTELPYSQTRPLAFKLYYQITVNSRTVQHDRYLLARFVTDIFPPRSFFLAVDADHTWRRCEMVDAMSDSMIETTETKKVKFRQVYTISIECEVPVDKVQELMKVSQLHIDFYERRDPRREAAGHPATGEHDVALAQITETIPSGP